MTLVLTWMAPAVWSCSLQVLTARLAAVASTVEALAEQLRDCQAASAVTLPQRLAAVEAKVTATAQTTADAVKVIALKHEAITRMFGEVQGGQGALEAQLQQLAAAVKKLQTRRRGSRGEVVGERAPCSSSGSSRRSSKAV